MEWQVRTTNLSNAFGHLSSSLREFTRISRYKVSLSFPQTVPWGLLDSEQNWYGGETVTHSCYMVNVPSPYKICVFPFSFHEIFLRVLQFLSRVKEPTTDLKWYYFCRLGSWKSFCDNLHADQIYKSSPNYKRANIVISRLVEGNEWGCFRQ